VGDTARSILDGHISLSRALADAGHFPSIDVLASISRVANAVMDDRQRALARDLRRLLAAWRDAKDLVDIGAYQAGADPDVDRALALRHEIDAFLQQGLDETSRRGEVWDQLERLLAGTAATAPPTTAPTDQEGAA
jgi:flagellum-specific ATP synthase